MQKKQLLFIQCLICALLQTTTLYAKVRVYDLRCEFLKAPLAIDNTQPHLSWKIESKNIGINSSAYQVLVASSLSLLNKNKADLWNSGKVNGANVNGTEYKGKLLKPRSLAYWKVRIWDHTGKETEWSRPSEFGIGLLGKEDWCENACFIGIPQAEGDETEAPLLRKTFDYTKKKERILLHVNSLGFHEAYLNGIPVSDAVLNPAVSQHNKRSLIVTYDVTKLMQKGKNELVLWIGRGWYQTFTKKATDGGPFVRAQLDGIDYNGTHTLLVTDKSWEYTRSGRSTFGTWKPHQMGGEIIDARNATKNLKPQKLKGLEWKPVIEAKDVPHNATPQMCELNRIKTSVHPTSVHKVADSAYIYDMGKNFVGFTKVLMPFVEEGKKIEFHYDDLPLNKNGDLREGLYTDHYIGGGSSNIPFTSKFNYKGYRYLKIKGIAHALPLKDITGNSIRTDYDGDVSFTCSDEDMNLIFNMVKRTLEALTLGGDMVDCPQIERLGYGGDGNASTPTLQSFFNVAPLYMNWMQAWADSQQPDGGMPHTAPNPYSAGGGPYWCGFIITASWQTYINYGDKRLLKRYYPQMQKWLEYAEKYQRSGLLKQWPNNTYRNWYLGDWATPNGINQTDSLSIDLVNNCFLSECYATMAKIASLFELTIEANTYKEKQRLLNKRIHETFYQQQNKCYSTGTQIDLIYPLWIKATPQELVNKVKATLIKVTQERFKGHLSTGLVGVPIITQWATEECEVNFMYEMLKKRSYPSYLYMIDNGATTTWEHWDGERSHIHNCYNGIGSWFLQALAGIRPDETNPGYKHIIIRPQMPKDITWVKAHKDSPYGRIEVSWHKDSKKIQYEISIPNGATATLFLEKNAIELMVNEKISSNKEYIILAPGKHKVMCTIAP